VPRRRSKVPLHVYVPVEVFDAVKDVSAMRGLKMSALVTSILEEWMNIKEKTSYDYEGLKKQYRYAVEQFKRHKSMMAETDPEGELIKEAENLGLDWDTLKNVEEVIAKLLKTYVGPPDKLHFFIDYLEAAKRMVDTEKRLMEARMQRYLSIGGADVAKAGTDTHPVRAPEGVSDLREHEAEGNTRSEVP